MHKLSKNYNIIYQPFVKTIRNIPEHINKPSWYQQSNPQFQSEDFSILKTQEEIQGIKEACQMARKCLLYAKKIFNEIETGEELDTKLTQYILEQNCYPSGIGFINFPKTICISPNDVLVHGVPNNRKFEEGDIVNLDLTIYKNGFYGDNSIMVTRGQVKDKIIEKLVFQIDKYYLKLFV